MAKASQAKPGPRNKKLYDDGMKKRKAVYCAIPAGLDAFKTARDVFQERGV